jgi:hypothetical protein
MTGTSERLLHLLRSPPGTVRLSPDVRDEGTLRQLGPYSPLMSHGGLPKSFQVGNYFGGVRCYV